MLQEMGIETGIDLRALIACSRRAQEILGRPLGSHTLVAGPVEWTPNARRSPRPSGRAPCRPRRVAADVIRPALLTRRRGGGRFALVAREALSRVAVAAAACSLRWCSRPPRSRPPKRSSASTTSPGGAAVPAGEIVGSQWESEGVKFGTAEEFGQPSVAGNCGKPTVGTGAVPAASLPNYAVLATCMSALQHAGHLRRVRRPRARVALGGSAQPDLRARTSKCTCSATRPAARRSPKGTWKRPTANGRRSSRRSTAKARSATSRSARNIVTSQEIAIDNLSFEAPERRRPRRARRRAPPPPPPPTAMLALRTPNPHAGEPITLSGAGSSPGSGRIISYGWNFKGGEKEETSTGTDPKRTSCSRPGAHDHDDRDELEPRTREHEFGLSLPKR